MVPLNYALQNGQRVEIIAAKQGGPSRDWLNPDLGYVHSHRARAKVRQWFKAQQLEATIAQGRAMVERELAARRQDGAEARRGRGARRASTSSTNSSPPCRAPSSTPARCSTAIQVVAKPGDAAALARADEAVPLRASKSARRGQRHPDRRRRPADDRPRALLQAGAARSDRRLRHARQGHNDPSRRVAATSRACRKGSPERLITADWGTPRDEVFPVDVVVEAMDRQGLLRDISRSFFAREDQRHRGQHADRGTCRRGCRSRSR